MSYIFTVNSLVILLCHVRAYHRKTVVIVCGGCHIDGGKFGLEMVESYLQLVGAHH